MIFFDVNETLLDLTPLRASVGDALGGRPELVLQQQKILTS